MYVNLYLEKITNSVDSSPEFRGEQVVIYAVTQRSDNVGSGQHKRQLTTEP